VVRVAPVSDDNLEPDFAVEGFVEFPLRTAVPIDVLEYVVELARAEEFEDETCCCEADDTIDKRPPGLG